MAEHEPRFTPDEMFGKYFDFLEDPEMQARLKKRGIRTWEHEELLLRFFAYVKNTTFIAVKKESEQRKLGMFGDPGDGTLFQLKKNPPHSSTIRVLLIAYIPTICWCHKPSVVRWCVLVPATRRAANSPCVLKRLHATGERKTLAPCHTGERRSDHDGRHGESSRQVYWRAKPLH